MGVVKISNPVRYWRSIHPLFRDFALTSVTGFAVVAASLLAVSLVGRMLGAVALGEYLLVRRVVAWLLSLSQLGLGVAMPRYIAQAVDSSDGGREAYFVAGLACMTVLSVTVGSTLLIARGFFSYWLLGSRQMTHLIFPLVLLLAGFAVHTAVYGYFRGCLSMGQANRLQFFNLALFPLVSVLAFYRSHSVALVVSAMGGAMLLYAAVFALPLLRKFSERGRLYFGKRMYELLTYGVPRIAGDFGLAALMAVGPVVGSHFVPVNLVAYLLLGGSILTGVTVATTPLGIILLSKVSAMLAQDRRSEVRDRLRYMVAAVIELSVFACLQLIVFADVLVHIWVGPAFLGGVSVIRITLIAIPFYLFYVALRSVIDAASVTAYNVRNIGLSLAVNLTFLMAITNTAPVEFLLHGIAGTLVLAFAVLAWQTARTVRHLLDLRVEWQRSLPSIMLGLLLGGFSLTLHRVHALGTTLVGFILVAAVAAALFVWISKKMDSEWLRLFWNVSLLRQIPVEVSEGI